MSRDNVATGRLPEGRTYARAALASAVLALLLRLACLASIPLIISRDGVGYLTWGVDLAERGSFDNIATVCTPGYPLFLAGVFTLFGVGPVGVLMAQHALGCVTCGLVALLACRLGGTRWGVLSGILCALDPWLLAIESVALTETLAVMLVALAATVVLLAGRPRWLVALLLGVLLGYACLVRPALQAIVPFFGLAWVVRSNRRWKPALAGLGLVIVGAALPLAPWLYFNQQRQVAGVASGYRVTLFKGLLRFGLLDREYPVSETIRQQLAAFDKRAPSWQRAREFVANIGGWEAEPELLGKWSRASIRKNLREYLRHCGYALCWQLNCFPRSGPDPRFDWLNRLLRRVAQDGDNIWFSGQAAERRVEGFVMSSRGGPVRRAFAWAGTHVIGGVPQVPLFALALLGTLLALLRRDWGLLLVLAGMLAFVASHVATLFPVGRYLMPMWPLWYVCLVVTPTQLADLVRRIAGRQRPDAGTGASGGTVPATG